MKRHSDSHLDHGLTDEQVKYLLTLEVSDGGIVTKTIKLPEALGTVPCALYGPSMNDDPVLESDVTYAVRGERAGVSRLVDRPSRPTQFVTVIAGPHDGLHDVLHTAFGGPPAPREPWELDEGCDDRAVSEAFWLEHALAIEKEGGDDQR